MSKPVKELITRELSGLLEDVDAACVVDLTGMDAQATHALRGRLREHNMRLRVVKNRIARRAFGEGPLAVLGRTFSGPCALVTGGESVIDLARELLEAAKEFPALKLKEGLIEGDSETTPVADMAKMMSLVETRADLVALILSPGRNLAGGVSAGGGKIAACIKTLIERWEEEQAADRPAA